MKFYVLEPRPKDSQDVARTDVIQAEDSRLGSAPRCPVCNSFIGMRQWLPPYRVELETWGTAFGDFAFGIGGWFLVSERFMHIYEREGLKGLTEFSPVEILKVTHHQKVNGYAPLYFKVTVLESMTQVNEAASGMEWDNGERACDQCFHRKGVFKRWERIVVQPETWNGEDIFTPRGSPVSFITSSRFQQICDAYNVSNAVLISADIYGHDFYPWEEKRRQELFP